MKIYLWNYVYTGKVYTIYEVASVDTAAKTITLTQNLPTSNFGVANAVIPEISGSGYQPPHAEGDSTIACGYSAHAEGYGSKATAYCAHAEGYYSLARNHYSHAEGYETNASGQYSHTEGRGTKATGLYSHAGGGFTISSANYQTAIGKHNVASTLEADKFIIGKGTGENSRANCLRVTHTGVYASGNYNASGADYAELFEWLDGNPSSADRVGLFVTLDGEKLRLAGPEDDFILGVVSGNPSVVGDVHDDQWQGMFLSDIYGRPLWEDVEVPAETEEREEIILVETGETGPDGSPVTREEIHTETVVIEPARVEHRQKLNPDYDNAQPYVPRTQRPEWAAVGLLGKLVVRDDGTCEVNGWACVGQGGQATASQERTKFRVMSRLDPGHVQVLVL